MGEAMISMQGVTIRFGDLIANDCVSLDVKKGEIVALLGENGAGKSTLMKILYGLYTRESGDIVIDGVTMPRRYSPSDALAMGVAMVPQHFMLVDAFSVAENIVLGEEQKLGRYFVNRKAINSRVAALCQEFGIDVSPDQKVEKLPLGVKQKIEILKALYRESKILVLDEPTTVLTPQEVDELFILLRSLQAKGMTIIIITHKLHEVLSISDRVTVMRLGKNAATFNTKDTNIRELSRVMVGSDVESVHVEQSEGGDQPEPYLTIENVCTKSDGDRCNLKELTLNLYPGKIVGVAGIDGNGQTELVEVLTGVKPIQEGKLIAEGQAIKNNSCETMKKLGIGVIPEDRSVQGLILDLSIRDNILVGYKGDDRFSKYGLFRMQNINSYVDDLIGKYDIRPTRKSAVCRFVSGGNQQKVVLARELERPLLRAVIASQPSRGLDVGAIQFTYQTLLKLREEGKAILLISSDLDEIQALSDDIAVIRNGQIVAYCEACEISKDEIGLFMGGSHSEEATA